MDQIFLSDRWLLVEQNENNEISISITNSKTSNIIETDIPRYNESDPPIADIIVDPYIV